MARSVSSAVFFFIFISAFAAFAQRGRDLNGYSHFDNEQCELRGQVLHDRGTPVNGLFVEVREVGGTGMAQRVPVGALGDYFITGLGSGTYSVLLTDMAGNVITEQVVSPCSMSYVQLRVPHVELARPPSGSVSLFELEHKIPSRALKEAETADKVLAKTHDLQLYIEHVKKAVEIDPDYLPALRNLGVAYLKTGQNEKAIAAFDEALKRDPHSALTYAASSAAYLGLQNYSGAETAARRALQIDSALEVCRYYLGVSLQLQHKNDAEALELLSKVAHDYPKAHLSAAEILERTGHKDDAKGQLNAYLKSGETDVRAEVKTWLSSLN